jgi:hypothetical protein
MPVQFRCGTVTALVGMLALAAAVRGTGAAQRREGEATVLQPLPKGTATWAYHYADGIARQVQQFNRRARHETRFRYLFPYAGSPSIDADKRRITMHYDAAATQAYARALPGEVLLMPIVDARNDDRAFDGWSEKEYREAARQVAQCILDDPHAAGVQIDIEPFSPVQLPFYRSLRELLNAKGKYCTMFVGPRDEETLTRVFASCDLAVVSGYDLEREGISLARYRQALRGALVRVQQAAEAARGHYLVGIPAAASWGEYEYLAGGPDERQETGVKQEQYVQAALDAVKPYLARPECLGLSLWHMSDPEGECERPEAATSPTKFPNVIRPSVWRLLERYP